LYNIDLLDNITQMSNLTSIVAVIQIVAGIVALLVPSIGINGSAASALIALGLSTLGISQKVSNQSQVVGSKGIW
jgi:hypothetical protein